MNQKCQGLFLRNRFRKRAINPTGNQIPEYIILEDEGPPELEEAKDDDGYVEDVVRGPCVYVPDLGVYVLQISS
jgi:hypothetical protein